MILYIKVYMKPISHLTAVRMHTWAYATLGHVTTRRQYNMYTDCAFPQAASQLKR